MQVTFKESRDEAKHIKSFHFVPTTQVDYTPGQFITITLGHDAPDNRGIERWFTLASSPTENDLMIATKFYDKPSSFKQTLHDLQPGATADIEDPEGEFTLPEKPGKPLVFVAGGIGVTPYRSIIKYLSDKGSNPYDIQLIYAANTKEELAFRDLFDNGLENLKVTYLVRDADADWDGPVGTLSGQKIAELAGNIKDKVVYLSGPEPMVETLETELQDMGQPDEGIMTDFFPNYPDY